MSDPMDFGRVDAEGNVFVKTAAGERLIGSWQAGTPEEGLAHFARRYADLVTEVDLIEARLGSGAADASQSLSTIRRLRGGLDEAHVVGDIDGLAARLDKLTSIAEDRAGAARAARDAARAESLARKTALVEEAEVIAAQATGWKTAGDRLREILDEWKSIRAVDKKTEGELWRRYAAARDAFTRRRGAHFATLDAARKQAQDRKEELIGEAEKLAKSTEWHTTAERLRELMDEWKAAPRAAKEIEQRLWQRFRAAQDAFFTRRSEAFAAREAEVKGNLARKQDLLARAEALDVDSDPKRAQSQLRAIREVWHDTGRVPRDVQEGLDRRLRAVEDRVTTAMNAVWRRVPPHESPLLAQMREQVARAEQQLASARAAGDARRTDEAEKALARKRAFLTMATGEPLLPVLVTKTVMPVDSYLDTHDEAVAQRVFAAADDLARLLGYEGPIDEEIRRGSFWRRARAVQKQELTAEQSAQVATSIANPLGRSAEPATLNLQIVDATTRLLEALAPVPNACICLPGILVVKYTDGAEPMIQVRHLTPTDVETIERHPEVLRDPRTALQKLARAPRLESPDTDDAAVVTYEGAAKLEICKRLGDQWTEIADLVGIRPHEREKFEKGYETRELWEYLERRGRLAELHGALIAIDRMDLARVLEPSARL